MLLLNFSTDYWDTKEPEGKFLHLREKARQRLFFSSFSPGWHLPVTKRMSHFAKLTNVCGEKHWRANTGLLENKDPCLLSETRFSPTALMGRATLATCASCDRRNRERSSWPCSLHFLSLKLFGYLFIYLFCNCAVCFYSPFSLQSLRIYEGQLPHIHG